MFHVGDKVYCVDNEGDVVYAGIYLGESLELRNHSRVYVRIDEEYSIERLLPHHKMVTLEKEVLHRAWQHAPYLI